MASVIAALFVGCGGASSSSSSRSDGVNRCYPRGHTGAATYDEAREASHQSNTGDPARPVAYGTRAGAETPPEWWGRGEVDPCADEERPNLSGPLLLDDDAPGADEPEAPETEPLDPER